MKRDLVKAAVAWVGALIMTVVIAVQMTYDNRDMMRYYGSKEAARGRTRARRNENLKLVYK